MTDRVSFLNVTLKYPEREDDVEHLVNAIKQFSNVMDVEIIKHDYMLESMIYQKIIKIVVSKTSDFAMGLFDEVRNELDKRE